jgi:hypothetical protein
VIEQAEGSGFQAVPRILKRTVLGSFTKADTQGCTHHQAKHDVPRCKSKRRAGALAHW